MQPIDPSTSSRHSKRRFLNVRRKSLLVLCLLVFIIVTGKDFLVSRINLYNSRNYSLDTVNKKAVSMIPKEGTLCSGISLEISEYIKNIYSKTMEKELLSKSYNDRHLVMSAPQVEPEIEIPEWFLYSLARLITAEGSVLNDEAQQLIGYVFLNRMRSPYFPDTFDDVFHDGDSYHPETHKFVNSQNAPSERALDNARICLENYYSNSIPVPDCLVYQSEFYQGAGAYREIKNMKFCLDDRSGYTDDYKTYLN